MKNKSKILFGVLILFIFSSYFFTSSGKQWWIDILRLERFKKIDSTELEETGPEKVYKFYKFSERKIFSDWKNKVFKGKTVYWIDEKGSEKFLHSKSEKTSSALYHLMSYDVTKFPIISWKWRPVKFPNKKGVTDPKLKDDYALRLYVIFASGFFTNFKCVEYLWDETMKQGTKMESPYSNNIMQMIIRSGKGAENGEWVSEERNILEDYITLFGEKPKLDIRAIAVMSDSEGTQDSAEANFEEIKISKKL